MTAQKLDGKATAAAIKSELAERVAVLRDQGVVPGLGTVLVGEDPASHQYVAGKHRDCAQVGIESIRVDLPADVTEEELAQKIRGLNANPHCTGYIVQLPPPRGIVELLTRHGIELPGANVCVVGRGTTVGRPLGLLLTRRSENCTVTLCHTGTRNLAEHTRQADIIIGAAGSPGLINADMIREGAVLVDVGVSRTAEGKIQGDFTADVWEKAAWVSPNPGGVGPMTRAMLLSNVVDRAERLAADLS